MYSHYIIGVNVTLSRESYFVEEETGFITICSTLNGELQRPVDVVIFTVQSSAQGERFYANNVVHTTKHLWKQHTIKIFKNLMGIEILY